MYADISGLKMFCEIRGTSDPVKVPLVLHGAISATGTSFGRLPDLLAQPGRSSPRSRAARGGSLHLMVWRSGRAASARSPLR